MKTAITTIALILSIFITAPAAAEPARILGLEEAIAAAREHQPQLAQAAAARGAAEARLAQARAALMPQVSASSFYQRATDNPQVADGYSPYRTSNRFSFSVSASQLLYDGGQALYSYAAVKANARAGGQNERLALDQVVYNVRAAFFTARAARALVKVQEETLANEGKHLEQIQGFVAVGTHPEIDLAQVQADMANARLALINAQNAYATAKSQLNLAMGVEGPLDYDVADDPMPAVQGEDQSTESLLPEAGAARPDLAALEEEIKAQESSLSAVKAAYWPKLNLSTSYSKTGNDVETLPWNWAGGVTLDWSLFQGGLTRAQAAEARQNFLSLKAQRAALKQQIRLDVEQATLAIRAASTAITTADDVIVNAKKRLDLAEGRYQTGIGNIIELGDAQVALTNAEAQKVQAEYNLSSARAQLLKALGRI